MLGLQYTGMALKHWKNGDRTSLSQRFINGKP